MTTAPSGRARKPTPKVAKVLSSEFNGSLEGKKLRAIAAARKP
jgi:hypothetical protein